MPKGGSGFIRGAGRAASAILRGESREWRLGDYQNYAKEIVTLYQSMYRSGIVMVRDSRGGVKEWGGSDAAIDKALERISELSNRMAQNVQVYNQSAAESYSNLRQAWGKPVYVNSRELQEFRNTMQAGDRMLINPRGVRGVASDAATRAAEANYRTTSNNNVGILNQANREMNATRNAIWQNASKSGSTEQYASEIYNQLVNRYEKTERGAWRRRRS